MQAWWQASLWGSLVRGAETAFLLGCIMLGLTSIQDPESHVPRSTWPCQHVRCTACPAPKNDPLPHSLHACGHPVHGRSRPGPAACRPREKVNRPQTRRRRENTSECLEKCMAIRTNLLKSLEVTEMVLFREARKRDIIVSAPCQERAQRTSVRGAWPARRCACAIIDRTCTPLIADQGSVSRTWVRPSCMLWHAGRQPHLAQSQLQRRHCGRHCGVACANAPMRCPFLASLLAEAGRGDAAVPDGGPPPSTQPT